MKDSDYCQKVLPFLREEYFTVDNDRILYNQIKGFITKYNNTPTKESIQIDLDASPNLKDAQVKQCQDLLDEIDKLKENSNLEWLLDNTETFCQEKAIYHAMTESIEIMNDSAGKNVKTKGSIPKLLSDALAISFDPHVGHDYLEDAESRYEFYHRAEERIPFDLTQFNDITKGGIPRKTLNIIIAGINVGKTLIMCHLAAAYLASGKNVLYITLEMAEERISERIDANLLNIVLDDLSTIPKDTFMKKVETLKKKTQGKLIVKEYPTSQASVMHFHGLLNELLLKKNYKPDVIIIDYINICQSQRLKPGSASSYFYIKAIAEEFRGLGVELNIPIWSATQLTRGAFKSSEVDMDDTAESFGLPATADFMFAAITDDELEQQNQYMIIQLKNRYNSKKRNKKFVIGVDYDRMKLYDVEQPEIPETKEQGIATTALGTPKVASQRAVNKFKDLKVTPDVA